jgi:hypothetical protein
MRKRARNHQLLVEWNKDLKNGMLEPALWYDGYYKNDPYYETQGRTESRRLIPIQESYRNCLF